jgi:hypothetical protein
MYLSDKFILEDSESDDRIVVVVSGLQLFKTDDLKRPKMLMTTKNIQN